MRMNHRILHLSDTHLTVSGIDGYGVDAIASLKQILFDARHLDGLSLVLVSGDVADDGSAAGYLTAVEIIGDFAASRGIPLICAMGNHDDRAAFAQVLGSGHRGAGGDDIGRDWAGGPERAAVSEVAGLRMVTLDSQIPGSGNGLISAAQLRWLAGLLADPAPAGTVVAFHHPPVHVPTSAFVSSAGLRNAEELASVVAGSDVQAILCGHFHVQLAGHLSGVPVWVTPGVVTRIDLTAPRHLVRTVKGASATVVDLGGPFSPAFHVLHARDPEVGQQAYLVDALTWQPVGTEETTEETTAETADTAKTG
jgi:Icc protein